jgi:hypothetical protein
MKKIIILLVLALTMVSCLETREGSKKRIVEKYGECNFKLEIEYITGTVETVSYKLPSPTNFYVTSYNGSYNLRHSFGAEDNFERNLIAGVVRYKLLKKTCN